MGLLFASVLNLFMRFAQPVDATVAIRIEYATPQSRYFEAALRLELEQSTLADGSGLRLASQLELRTGHVRERLIVVKILGECRIPSGLPPVWRPDPLAWVERMNGSIQPFVYVDCNRLSETLRRKTADASGVARAVALVIRHEMRHILLQTGEHERRGEYKAALRADELIHTTSEARR